jgi:NADH-quinone oxidoreductase subunit L
MFIAALALCGIPPFAGFWSKDLIIEATMVRDMGWVSDIAYYALLSGVFMTAFYTFRMFFLTFHNTDRVSAETKAHLHESPKVITIPLMILAIGAFGSGLWGVYELDITNPEVINGFFGHSLFVLDAHNPLMKLELEEHHAFYLTMPFWFAISGIGLAYAFYFKESALPAKLASQFPRLHTFLLNKWYWDELYEKIFIRPARCLGTLFWQKADLAIIDKGIIHGGIIHSVVVGAAKLRGIQTGMVYHYAYSMVIGVFVLLTWLLLKA